MCRDCGTATEELADGRCHGCWLKTMVRAGGEVFKDAMEEHPVTKSLLQMGRDWFAGREARLGGKKDEKP